MPGHGRKGDQRNLMLTAGSEVAGILASTPYLYTVHLTMHNSRRAYFYLRGKRLLRRITARWRRSPVSYEYCERYINLRNVIPKFEKKNNTNSKLVQSFCSNHWQGRHVVLGRSTVQGCIPKIGMHEIRVVRESLVSEMILLFIQQLIITLYIRGKEPAAS